MAQSFETKSQNNQKEKSETETPPQEKNRFSFWVARRNMVYNPNTICI